MHKKKQMVIHTETQAPVGGVNRNTTVQMISMAKNGNQKWTCKQKQQTQEKRGFSQSHNQENNLEKGS